MIIEGYKTLIWDSFFYQHNKFKLLLISEFYQVKEMSGSNIIITITLRTLHLLPIILFSHASPSLVPSHPPRQFLDLNHHDASLFDKFKFDPSKPFKEGKENVKLMFCIVRCAKRLCLVHKREPYEFGECMNICSFGRDCFFIFFFIFY